MRCRCDLMATAEGIGRRAPRIGRTGTLSLRARCLATDGGRHDEVPLRPEGNDGKYWPPRPAQKPRGTFFVTGEMPGDGRWATR